MKDRLTLPTGNCIRRDRLCARLLHAARRSGGQHISDGISCLIQELNSSGECWSSPLLTWFGFVRARRARVCIVHDVAIFK